MPSHLTVIRALIVLITAYETCMIVNSVDSEPSVQPLHVRKRRKLDLNKLPDEQHDLSSSSSEKIISQPIQPILLPINHAQQIAVLSQNEQVRKAEQTKNRKRMQSAKYYRNLTPEQKKARAQRNSSRDRKRLLNMSESEKVKFREKRNQHLINFRSRKSPEERKSLGRKYMKEFRARKKQKTSQQNDRITPKE